MVVHRKSRDFKILLVRLQMKIFRAMFKKIGDIVIDIAKIVFAVAVLTPFVKDGKIDTQGVLSSMLLLILGLYIYFEGVKDE